MNWQKKRFSQKQLTSESFDNNNKLTLKSFFTFAVFSLQGQTEETWKRLLDRGSVRFPKYSSVTLIIIITIIIIIIMIIIIYHI